MIGRPSNRDFKSMVRNNMIQNCHITAYDITNAQTMFGTNLTDTRGKIVRQKPDRVGMYYVSVPKYFFEITQVINYCIRCGVC